MWNSRLKNKTSFSKACSKLVKDKKWLKEAEEGKNIVIEPDLQKEILEGFKKFYDKESYKYEYVSNAIGIKWPGGFKRLYVCWRQQNEHWDTDYIFSQVVKNDVLSISAAENGFYTFTEPVLSNWKNYHAKHSVLQEISQKEHKKLTKIRRII